MLMNWFIQNYVEVLGAVTGLIYLYFSVNRLIWLWPFGILTSLVYTWVFFHSRLFADMSLQVYYFFVSIYGWYFWLRGGVKKNGKELPVSRLSRKMFYFSLAFILILTATSGYFLKTWANSSLPYMDAFTTAASIAATWMLARKILENWLFWIVIDLISMGMYIYKDLYATAVLFLVYSSIAILGYFNWKKCWKISGT